MIKKYIKLINCFKEYMVSIKPPKHYLQAFNNCVCFKHTNKKLMFLIYYTESINDRLIEVRDCEIFKRSTRLVFTKENIPSNKINDNYIHLSNLQKVINNIVKI